MITITLTEHRTAHTVKVINVQGALAEKLKALHGAYLPTALTQGRTASGTPATAKDVGISLVQSMVDIPESEIKVNTVLVPRNSL